MSSMNLANMVPTRGGLMEEFSSGADGWGELAPVDSPVIWMVEAGGWAPTPTDWTCRGVWSCFFSSDTALTNTSFIVA